MSPGDPIVTEYAMEKKFRARRIETVQVDWDRLIAAIQEEEHDQA